MQIANLDKDSIQSKANLKDKINGGLLKAVLVVLLMCKCQCICSFLGINGFFKKLKIVDELFTQK